MKKTERAIPILIAIILLWAAVDKMLHYEGFLNALRNYVLLPRGTAPYLAGPVILMELTLGLGMLLPRWRRLVALPIAAMFALFTIALAFNHFYGARGICGCWFTFTLAQGTKSHIIQNIILMVLSVSVWWDSRSETREKRHAVGRLALPLTTADISKIE